MEGVSLVILAFGGLDRYLGDANDSVVRHSEDM